MMAVITEIRNPVFNADGSIECEVQHSVYGWMPFTARADDVEAHGREVYERALAMIPAPYEAQPTAPPAVPQVVTRRQARQALLLAGRLQDVQPAIDAIADPLQRGMVQIEWDDSQEFHRTRPTLVSLATAIGMTDADLDALFVQAAQL